MMSQETTQGKRGAAKKIKGGPKPSKHTEGLPDDKKGLTKPEIINNESINQSKKESLPEDEVTMEDSPINMESTKINEKDLIIQDLTRALEEANAKIDRLEKEKNQLQEEINVPKSMGIIHSIVNISSC